MNTFQTKSKIYWESCGYENSPEDDYDNIVVMSKSEWVPKGGLLSSYVLIREAGMTRVGKDFKGLNAELEEEADE